MIQKHTIISYSFYTGVLIISLIAGATMYAEQKKPPLANRDTPLTTGLETESKDGSLMLNGIGTDIGLSIKSGKVGAGTDNPGYPLHVAGAIGADQFCNESGTSCLEWKEIDRYSKFAQEIPESFIPSGAILMYQGDCPSGYQVFTALNGRLPRGTGPGELTGATGGSDSHSHGISLPGIGLNKRRAGTWWKRLYSGAINVGNLPPYYNVVFCKKD